MNLMILSQHLFAGEARCTPVAVSSLIARKNRKVGHRGQLGASTRLVTRTQLKKEAMRKPRVIRLPKAPPLPSGKERGRLLKRSGEWSKKEDQDLTVRLKKGEPLRSIASHLGKKLSACLARKRLLGSKRGLLVGLMPVRVKGVMQDRGNPTSHLVRSMNRGHHSKDERRGTSSLPRVTALWALKETPDSPQER